MAAGREIELKYTFDAAGLAQVTAHPWFAPGLREARSAHLTAVYFDTPDRRLWRRGISLRVRDADGRKTETVKQAGQSSVDRAEWEFETDSPLPSHRAVRQTPVHRRLRGRNGEHELEAAFTVTVDRTSFDLVRGSARIEVAIDRGTIEGGGQHTPVGEVELELKEGDPADLFGLARSMLETLPLTPSLISKAERGFVLLGDQEGGPPWLRHDMPAPAAFQAIAESCLKDVAANAALITDAIDVEAVHRSRVALRRLRAALSLFGPILADERFDALRGEFRWMSGLLGRARDRDVFQTELFDPAAQAGATVGATELAEHMRREQRDAHADLVAALQSPRWRLAMGDAIRWIVDGSWRGAAWDDPQPLHGFVASRLRSRRKALVRAASGLAGLDPHERHAVRIRAKKLRYALDFFAKVPHIGKGSAAYRSLTKGLETLQSALGRLHDHEAQQELLRAQIAAWEAQSDAPGKQAAFVAGQLMGDRPDLGLDLKHAAAAARRIAKSDPF